jgi:hypothetical protein
MVCAELNKMSEELVRVPRRYYMMPNDEGDIELSGELVEGQGIVTEITWRHLAASARENRVISRREKPIQLREVISSRITRVGSVLDSKIGVMRSSKGRRLGCSGSIDIWTCDKASMKVRAPEATNEGTFTF